MYLDFFGLKELPFKITPDLEFFYRQSSRDMGLQSLKYAIDQGEGIIKVVGEVGAGKTTLLRLLAASLPKKFVIVYVPSPTLSPKEMLMFICAELGLELGDNMQKFQIIQLLQKRLIELYQQGRKVIMLIDEAQSCSVDTLEEIRLLSNLETEKSKLIQIVIFGQTELDITLNSLEAKPLKARISSSIFLSEFNPKEVQQYLNYRMRVAGYSGEDVFSDKVATKIALLTKGLPRSINIVADKLLLVAYSKGVYVVDLKMFNLVEGGASKRTSGVGLISGKGVLISVSLIIALLVFLSAYLSFEWKGVNRNVSVEKQVNDADVFKSVRKHTEDVVDRIPTFYYTGLLMFGEKYQVEAWFNQYVEHLETEQLEKVIIYCNDLNCAVLYGYSNAEQITEATLNTLPISMDKREFKTIKLSDLSAIIS